MTNEQLAKKITAYFPWWELDSNKSYNETLKALKQNDTKYIKVMLRYFTENIETDFLVEQSKEIVNELNKRLKGETL